MEEKNPGPKIQIYTDNEMTFHFILKRQSAKNKVLVLL